MRYVLATALSLFTLISIAAGQAGPRARPTGERAVLLDVILAREDGSPAQITAKDLALFDDGAEQAIQNLAPDPSPARIVLLVDNSLTLRTDVAKLAQSLREFAYEIYEGDQLLVVGYDEKPEVLSEWTDNAKQIEAGLNLLRKKGEPRLFDALGSIVDQALRPLTGAGRKRVIVVIGDGLDRGSKTRFGQILAELQAQDITVYALQIPDRTGGALRRDQPKPAQVLQLFTEGTGGRVLPFTEASKAAKIICDELRKNRYVLAYTPFKISYSDVRRLLVTAEPGINVRFKAAQPPH